MKSLFNFKMTAPSLFSMFPLVLLALLQSAQAVIPPPDGGYPGGNTAEGQNALLSLTMGVHNTAVGFSSLKSDTTGGYNTAVGSGTLFANTADGNTATGTFALLNNTTGFDNTAIGQQALFSNSTGHDNIALGANAGGGIGTAHGVICIGHPGDNVSNSCFIGHIRNVTTVNTAIPVVIATDGQLGTMSSSNRFKKEIKPMDEASKAILDLNPVTFHYNSDKTNTPQFGLIAEQVAQVSPDLVVRDENGEIYTVRYDAVNAMLLNEFLKAHRKLEKQEATIARQQKQIEALTAGLEKVSADLQSSKFATGRIRGGGPVPHMVSKD